MCTMTQHGIMNDQTPGTGEVHGTRAMTDKPGQGPDTHSCRADIAADSSSSTCHDALPMCPWPAMHLDPAS